MAFFKADPTAKPVIYDILITPTPTTLLTYDASENFVAVLVNV